jgi:type I restriction enzyme, S subunit
MKMEWPKVSLGELLRLERRPVKVHTDEQYQEIGIYCFGRGIFHKMPRTGFEVGDKELFLMKEGDFILQVTFAWEGALAIVSAAENGMYGSTRFPTFRVDQERCTPQFLLQYFKTKDGLEQLVKICPGSAGRNRVLSIKRIPEVLVPLPPVAEQQRIVARIEELVAKSEEVRGLCKEIEDDLSNLLSAAYQQITLGVPREPLGDIAPLNRRPVVVKINEAYPQVAVRSFGRGTFHKPLLNGSDVTWQKPFLVRAGDILISNIKAWEGAIAVARAEDDGRVGSHRYLTCVPVKGVASARFVCFHLLTPEGLYAVGEASPGSADRNRTLSAKGFLGIPVPVPEYGKQIWFEALWDEVDKVRRLHAETLTALDALTPSILDRAFRGEL